MNYLSSFILLMILFLTSSLSAQPQWLDSFDLPEQNAEIIVNDCSQLEDNDLGINELFSSDENLYSTFEDSVVYQANGNCEKVIRDYVFLHWTQGEVYELRIVFSVDPSGLTGCSEETFIEGEENQEVETSAVELLNGAAGDQVAFNLFDLADTIRTFAFEEEAGVFTFNATEGTLCFFNLLVTYCSAGVSFDFPSEIEIDMTEEKCIVFHFDSLQGNVDFPCGTYDAGFLQEGELDEKITLNYRFRNQSVAQKVAMVTEFGDTIERTVHFELISNEEDPFFITLGGDGYYEVGDTGIIPVGADVEQMYYLAGHFGFEGVEGIEVMNVHPVLERNGVSYNIDEEFFRFLFQGPQILEPKEIPSGEPWFSLKFVAKEAGNLSELINFDPIFLDEIGLSQADCEAYFILPVEYIFTEELTSSQERTIGEKLKIYPNPASERITIQGIPDDAREVIIYSVSGQMMETKRLPLNHSGRAEVSTFQLGNGMYFIDLLSDTGKITGGTPLLIQH